MEPQDDPEARIRDLERPLSDRARASELGTGPPGPDPYPTPTRPYATYQDPYPPPPPMSGPLPPMPPPVDGPPFPAAGQRSGSGIRVATLVGVGVLLIVGAGITGGVLWFINQFNNVSSFAPTPSAAPSIDIDIPPIVIPAVPRADTPIAPVGPGDSVSLSGVGMDRRIDCAGGVVSISGVDNTIEVTGMCADVRVSGMRNEVRVDGAAGITVSGFDNVLTYRDGDPQITESGDGNSVRRGD